MQRRSKSQNNFYTLFKDLINWIFDFACKSSPVDMFLQSKQFSLIEHLSIRVYQLIYWAQVAISSIIILRSGVQEITTTNNVLSTSNE